MNKNASVFILSLMFAVLFFFVGIALAYPLTEIVQESTSTTLLNCSNSSISVMKQAVCTQLDITAPIFIGIIMGIGGAFLGAYMGK